MVDSKLDVLKTEITPERITLRIELVPVGKELFDAPIDDIVSKVNQIANYIKPTLGIRTSQLGPKKESKKESAAVKRTVEQQELVETKLIKKGNERVLKVLEYDLGRAKEDKNPAAIEKAELALKVTKERMEQPLE